MNTLKKPHCFLYLPYIFLCRKPRLRNTVLITAYLGCDLWNHFGFSNPTAYVSDVSGKLAFDKENPEKSSVNVTLPVKTIDAHVKALTDEFLGKSILMLKRFPTPLPEYQSGKQRRQ